MGLMESMGMGKQRKTKRKPKGIPILIVIGVGVMVVFYFMYGGMMLLRYILGAIMFATVTIALIKLLNKYFGRKRLCVR